MSSGPDSESRIRKLLKSHVFQAFGIAVFSMLLVWAVFEILWRHWDLGRQNLDNENLDNVLSFLSAVVSVVGLSIASGLGWYVIQEYREAHPTHELEVLAQCFTANGNYIPVPVIIGGPIEDCVLLNFYVISKRGTNPTVYAGLIASAFLYNLNLFWSIHVPSNKSLAYRPVFHEAGGKIYRSEAIDGSNTWTLVRFNGAGLFRCSKIRRNSFSKPMSQLRRWASFKGIPSRLG